jgi:hypothetical protein
MAEATTPDASGNGNAEGEKMKERASTADTYEEGAWQEIRQARRLAVDGKPTPEATLHLSIASVLAL